MRFRLAIGPVRNVSECGIMAPHSNHKTEQSRMSRCIEDRHFVVVTLCSQAKRTAMRPAVVYSSIPSTTFCPPLRRGRTFPSLILFSNHTLEESVMIILNSCFASAKKCLAGEQKFLNLLKLFLFPCLLQEFVLVHDIIYTRRHFTQ